MRVGELCNREVVYVSQDQTVREAAATMREYHVGDVVVTRESDGARIPIGILTDRDIALHIVAPKVDPDSLTVADAMSPDLITAGEDDAGRGHPSNTGRERR